VSVSVGLGATVKCAMDVIPANGDAAANHTHRPAFTESDSHSPLTAAGRLIQAFGWTSTKHSNF
jgi:hypothetical protein